MKIVYFQFIVVVDNANNNSSIGKTRGGSGSKGGGKAPEWMHGRLDCRHCQVRQ